jgi:S-DNA-T family DNA segregation ATPase FtsK/SpoIIIE
VAGTTGSGKTALVRTMIISLALTHKRRHLGFVLIDPKGRAFGPLAALPHLLRPVAQQPEEAAQRLNELVRLMLRRDWHNWPPAPRVVVVIDELADLLMTSPEAQVALTRLSQRGREAGLHLIACAQKPSSKVIGSLAKANFPVRLVGRVTSPADARCAAGIGGSGAERLSGMGDFVVVAGGQITRFQAAYISRRELAEVVNHIKQQT